MITSAIGKQFIEFYNKKNGTSYTPEVFFTEVFVPLFFDHPKYMMTGGNSPLENPKIKWKSNNFPSEEERADRISKTLMRMKNDVPDASIAIGYPAKENSATTASQVTDIDFNHSSEDAFSSWIGSALSVGVKGGFSILFMDNRLLYKVYEGWVYYRSLLNSEENSLLKGLQIQTWNGVWLLHATKPDFDKENFLYEVMGGNNTSEKDGVASLDTAPWASVMLGIAQIYQEAINIYVYNIGQMNTTIGFLRCDLNEIRRPVDFYTKIFGVTPTKELREKIFSLLGGSVFFKVACLAGQIGVKALEPTGLKQYLPSRYNNNLKTPDYKKADSEQLITYNTYISWIMAMLNDEQLWEMAGSFGLSLVQYSFNDPKKVSRTRENEVKAVLDSRNKKQFIESLTEILKSGDEVDSLVEMGKFVNKMANENLSYFITLIKFRYYEMLKNHQEGK